MSESEGGAPEASAGQHMKGAGTASRVTRADRWMEDGQLRLREAPMILMYHGVAEVAEDPNLLCVSPRRFAEQMDWLQRRGPRGGGVSALGRAARARRPRGLAGSPLDAG